MRSHGFILMRDRLRERLRRLAGRDPHAPFRLPPGPGRAGARDGVAVVAIVRDEADYLPEWIAFHAMLGVRASFSTTTARPTGRRRSPPRAIGAPRSGASTGRASTGWTRHRPSPIATRWPITGPDFRWMAFIDVDEFLFPLEDESLPAALSRFEGQPCLSLPWFNFGPDGHATRPDAPVIAAYRERAAFPPGPEQSALLRFKSIVDPAEVTHGGTHHFGYRGLGLAHVNEAGEVARPEAARRPGFARSEMLRLNHYFTRSEAELAAKLAKGRVSANGRLNTAAYDRRMAQYARATVRDEAILRFLPGLEARLGRGGA